jgi:flavocytochrome c
MANKVIIIGGGLSGLSAAHMVLEHGGCVLLLEKSAIMGGNSSRATSGINAALTKTQVRAGVQDSVDAFYEDTAKGARDRIRPELVKVLCGESAAGVEWLQEKFELDLSLLARLGGHSFPRTHRGKERFPGMTITYALMEALEAEASKADGRATIRTKARVDELICDASGRVVGVRFVDAAGNVCEERAGAVVIATGGYGADFTETSLLAKHRPDLVEAKLSTTNGSYTTGDGIKMAAAVGADCVDMDMVQVHPTGLVDPADPNSGTRWLAAEALRGVGGVLLNGDGRRFCDELGHRDYVTGEMNRGAGPFRLVLNSGAAKSIEWHCTHYAGKGLMKKLASGAELAAEIGCAEQTLRDTFERYSAGVAADSDEHGRKYFANAPYNMDDTFHVAVVTPVVHYTMGGLHIRPDASVARQSGDAIAGLFACGEVCGGVHGVNRLGGSSLLDCVVFGRTAGVSAARHLLANATSSSAAAASSSPLAPIGGDGVFRASIHQPSAGTTNVAVDTSNNKVSLSFSWDDAQPKQSQAAAAARAVSATAPGGAGERDPSHVWSADEVAQHNSEDDCWVIVNGRVLDVTNFLADHPGGAKAILAYAGRDATEQFNLLHKPDVVEKYAPESVIGVLGESSLSSSSSASGTDVDFSYTALGLEPGDVQTRNSGGTAQELPRERAKSTFDVSKMTNFLDGGEEETKRRRFITSPNLGVDASGRYTQTPAERLKAHVRHFIQTHQPYWNGGGGRNGSLVPSRVDIGYMQDATLMGGSMMNTLGLFLPTLASHASDEQKMWWLLPALQCGIVGCYAQTELGHGSNVRGLQTTATYDRDAQEFVLDTPTLQSMKWWPGTLGKVATHAIVYAQLIIDGKEYGVHSFMLQLRDEEHMPLDGIELGDLGPKLGDAANDTGYMRLNRVRVPREYMLARFQEVTADGQYVKTEEKKKNPQLHYSTMLFTRGAMVRGAGGRLAMAAVIAARYACVRRQGFANSSQGVSFQSKELQIIDWQVQRYRVLKQVALTYAIKFTGKWLTTRFSDVEGLDNLDGLAEIAATTAGLKALCTLLTADGIEDLRKCCGGNGYLLASGIGALSQDYVWNCTAEGSAYVMLLQTGRFLFKQFAAARAGKQLSAPMAYLKPLGGAAITSLGALLAALDAQPPRAAAEPTRFADIDYLLELFGRRALIATATAGFDFHRRLDSGEPIDEARNHCALSVTNAARAHCFLFLLQHFVDAVNEARQFDHQCGAALNRLCALFACSNIVEQQWAGILSATGIELASATVTELMHELRPDVVSLTDAFEIADNILNSAIGRYDGNVYEALYQSARRSTLNRQEVFDGYKQYIQPHLDTSLLEIKNQRAKL